MAWNRRTGPFPWWWPVAVVMTTSLAVGGLWSLFVLVQERGVFQEPEGAWRTGRLALAGVGVLVLLAALMAVAAYFARDLPLLFNGYLWTLGGLLFLVGLGIAVDRNQLSLALALPTGLLGVLALLFSFLFLRAATFGEPLLVESHWGGLGGGLGGWRVSAALTFLAAALVFGLLLAGLTFQQVTDAGEGTSATEEERPAEETGAAEGTEEGEAPADASEEGESATGEETDEGAPDAETPAGSGG